MKTARWTESYFQDLRYGFSLLRRDAGVSALIILVLALGIGGNTAIFTLLKAAFVDPLPYRDAGRLVTITENTGWTPSVGEFLEIRARNHTLDSMAFAEHLDMQVTGSGEPARIVVARVSASFFPLLGVNASLGRTILPEENQPGRTPPVVLSDSFWRSRFAADPAVIGRELRLDGQPAIVVGVLPSGFHFNYPALGISEPVDLYVPYALQTSILARSAARGGDTNVLTLARMRSGVTLAQTESDMRNIASALRRENPREFPNPRGGPVPFTFEVSSLRDAIVGTERSLLWLLLGGVGVLLLIACANTAQLLLARSLRRSREIAIRAALGAGRGRLVRQFLLEGIVLAACGGAIGLAAGGWILRVLVALLPTHSPQLESAHLDTSVALFTLALSMISALVFAVVPAMKGSQWTLGPSLNAKATGGEGNRWRYAMIALEAALSMFLLCGAGLVAQNLWTLISTPIGIDPDHVLVMQIKLPQSLHQNALLRANQEFQRYLERIATIPGVEGAATVTGPPLRNARTGNTELEGVMDASGRRKVVWSDLHSVSPDYFRVLRIPVLAGRVFRRDDAGPRLKVAIVNEEFARSFGFGRDIVGKEIFDPAGNIEIVGLVGNVRTRGLTAAAYPEGYLSSLQLNWGNAYLMVRSAIPPGQLVQQVRGAIEALNSDQAVYGVMTMREMISDSVSQPLFQVFLIAAFALLAVAMAMSGLYSVIACLVSQRLNEIAIRIALGAGRAAIIRTVLGTTTVWVTVGLAAGLALGLLMRNTVRDLSDTAIHGSPWMYATLVLLFQVTALIAAAIPVRRAVGLDPATALRCE
jgi:predicted permease